MKFKTMAKKVELLLINLFIAVGLGEIVLRIEGFNFPRLTVIDDNRVLLYLLKISG